MTWPVVLASLALAQVLVAAAAIALGELVVEETAAQVGEWGASLALAVGALLSGLSLGAAPFLVLLASLVFSAVQFLIDAGAARVGSALADLGTTWSGLGPRYPVAAAALLAVVFLPTGLGPALGAPDLFHGLALHYWGGIVAGAGVLALFYRLEDDRAAWVLRWLLTLALVAGVALLAPRSTGERGRATVAALLFALGLGIEALAAAFFVVGPEEMDRGRLSAEGKIVLASMATVLAAWILPLVAG